MYCGGDVLREANLGKKSIGKGKLSKILALVRKTIAYKL